jgi:hypothetical protein
MSSYLNNLVLRNQQAIDVVHPRLPSVFEPPAALPFMPSTPHQTAPLEADQLRDQADGPEALTTRRESELRMPDPATPVQMIPAWRGLQVIEEVKRITVPRVAGPTAQASHGQSAHSLNVANATERGGYVLTADTTADTGERPSDRHQPEREARRESQPQPPAPAPHPKQPGVIRLFTDSAEEQPAVNESFADTADRRVVVQPRVSLSPQPANESGKSRVDGSRSREPFAHQAAEPPMPTINVTIGRIEVKALPPAAAPPPPRKPQPSLMSLDEYMRRRNAGGDSR